MARGSLDNFEILIAVLLIDTTAGHTVLTRGDILRVTSYELRVTSYELQVTRYLRILASSFEIHHTASSELLIDRMRREQKTKATPTKPLIKR